MYIGAGRRRSKASLDRPRRPPCLDVWRRRSGRSRSRRNPGIECQTAATQPVRVAGANETAGRWAWTGGGYDDPTQGTYVGRRKKMVGGRLGGFTDSRSHLSPVRPLAASGRCFKLGVRRDSLYFLCIYMHIYSCICLFSYSHVDRVGSEAVLGQKHRSKSFIVYLLWEVFRAWCPHSRRYVVDCRPTTPFLLPRYRINAPFSTFTPPPPPPPEKNQNSYSSTLHVPYR